MIRSRNSRAAGVAVAAAALALPAAASAHPSAYVASAPVACTAPAAPYTAAQFLATCTNQTRYVFTNHGNTYLLRESNGRTTGGAISYAHRPAGLAAASDFNIFASAPQGPTTGAQPHATCDVAVLTAEAPIRRWQGDNPTTPAVEADPFYAYVPFQRNPVGVDDESKAALWRAEVQTLTGVNLDTVADTDAAREAVCETLPGATASSYAPADATQNTLAAWSAGQVRLATAPLEEEIHGLEGALAARSDHIKALDAVGADSAQQVSALQSEIATLRLALRSLKLALPAQIPSAGGFAQDGMALTLAGPANRTVQVRVKVSALTARKLKLKARILSSQSVTTGADGNAAFVAKPGATAAAALRKAKGTVAVAVDAASGDRYNLVSATLGT